MAREFFLKYQEIKKQLWGGSFWTSGYYANAVGLYGSRYVIMAYFSNQGNEKKYKNMMGNLHCSTNKIPRSLPRCYSLLLALILALFLNYW